MTEYPGLRCEYCEQEAIAILDAYERGLQFKGLDMIKYVPVCHIHGARFQQEEPAA